MKQEIDKEQFVQVSIDCETQVPIKYPCIVLGYEDKTYNKLHYDFVYLFDFNYKLGL